MAPHNNASRVKEPASYIGAGGAVTIPSAINGLPVTSIGSYAFSGCTRLANVVIPAGVTNIGSWVFDGCTNLSAITVNPLNPVYSSANGVLFDKHQTLIIHIPKGIVGSFTIPANVMSIGTNLSGHTRLSNITIGNHVADIGERAFSGCTSLTNVSIPDGVTNVGNFAFSGCSNLSSIKIPASVTNIGGEAFDGCTALHTVTVDLSNSVYSSVGGALFNKGQTALILFPKGKAGNYTIPKSVTDIGNNFSGCTSLTSVVIGSGVTSIGREAFARCTSLTNVTIPASVTNIGHEAFFMCSRLTSVTIPSNVTMVGNAAFASCGSLTNVTLGNNITYIGNGAFAACSHLSSITIPDSVPKIGRGVFSTCTNLTAVYFKGNAPELPPMLSHTIKQPPPWSRFSQRAIARLDLHPLVFSRSDKVTVYYLLATIGWGPTFDGRPIASWQLPAGAVVTNAPANGP